MDRLEFLRRFWPEYLSEQEYRLRLAELNHEYYQFLAERLLHCVGSSFWKYQAGRLEAMGAKLDRLLLGKAVAAMAADLVLNPKQSAEKVLRRIGA